MLKIVLENKGCCFILEPSSSKLYLKVRVLVMALDLLKQIDDGTSNELDAMIEDLENKIYNMIEDEEQHDVHL